ncbi:MAG: hypothetical protein ABI884_11660 [Gemmatimonadota bacterium]
MIQRSLLGLTLAAALTTVSARSLAQTTAVKSASIGVMGGLTFPHGSGFTDLVKRGWNAGALIRLGVPAFPLSFRIDGQWHQLKGKPIDAGGAGTYTTDLRIIDGTANFEWTLGKAAASNFYLIGGGGVYGLRERSSFLSTNEFLGSSTSTSNATKFGWNAGAGFRFQLTGISLFVEGRYHSISAGKAFTGSGSHSLHIIPVTLGIAF